jgi:hypothetical protein
VSEPETTYSAGWLAGDRSWLPAVSQEQIAREEVRERRAAGASEAARAEALENAEFLAARECRDTSLAGALARAQRSMRATDYKQEKAELAERIRAGEVTVLDGRYRGPGRSTWPPTTRPTRCSPGRASCTATWWPSAPATTTRPRWRKRGRNLRPGGTGPTPRPPIRAVP